MNVIRFPHGFGVSLDLPYAHALARTHEALVQEGFGILSEIDLAATLRSRLGAEVGPYVLLGVCSPPLALRALDVEPSAGLLLPCTVAVYAAGEGRTVVAALDPQSALATTGNADLHPIGVEAAAKLQRVLDRLEAPPAPSAPPAPVSPVPELVEEIC